MVEDIERHRRIFRRRVLILLCGFAALGALVVLRLVQLQVVQADQYRQEVEAWLTRPPEYLPALRGRILDRNGKVLAEDVPSWQVEAHYGAMAGDRRYIRRLARIRLKQGLYPPGTDLKTAEELLRQDIAESWQRLAELAGKPTWQILQTISAVLERIEVIRKRVSAYAGIEMEVAEQRQFHPVLSDLDYETACAVRLKLADCPWLRVSAGTTRHYLDDPAFVHLLGKLGEVSAELLKADPHAGDELLALRPGEKVGVSGVEWLAQQMLRGRRGKIVRDRDGNEIERIDPVNGLDVRLTIDADLQRWVYQRLGQEVRTNPTASGAAAVVLDVRTRQVLALVSWPGYTREEFRKNYNELANDPVRMPLLFRAVAGRYPPGSIVKPVTLIAGLATGVVRPDEIIVCNGRLFAGVNRWRCWTVWRGLPPHGPQNAVEGLMHSCNIYFFTVGQRLGVARLTQWFDMFGLGRPAGTGLKEEAAGVLPSPAWLREARGRWPTTADARNYAIGQGEILITPIQAANIAATLATGTYQPVTLLRNESSDDRPKWQLPGTPDQWQTVREGLYRVVNDPSGTAYRYARSRRVAICGKTGTAQASPRVTSWLYEVELPDGKRLSLEFPTSAAARRALASMPAAKVISRKPYRFWPFRPDGQRSPTHAWFIAYAPAESPEIAVAVLIEYGGSGGRVAGPVAKDIVEHILSRQD